MPISGVLFLVTERQGNGYDEVNDSFVWEAVVDEP